MITILGDAGYCYGVLNAITILQKTAQNYPHVFLTHPLIHSTAENQKLLAENHASLYQTGDILDGKTAVVFSAHGHPLEEEKPFLGKATLVSATCPLIEERYLRLSDYDPNISYLFLGKPDHEETLGFLSRFPFLLFVDATANIATQIASLPLKEKTVLVPQTTVSAFSYEQALQALKGHTIAWSLRICPLYESRAKAALRGLAHVNPSKAFVIVGGDMASSNATEIANAVRRAYPDIPVVIANTINGLTLSSLHGKDIYLVSATSTSTETILQLKDDLEKVI